MPTPTPSILFRQSSGVIKYSRWLLFLTTVLISLLLTGTGIRGLSKANTIGRTIVETRAKDILAGVRRSFRLGEIPSDQMLQDLLQDMEKQDLSYLSIMREEGEQTKLIFSTGKNILPIPSPLKLKAIKKRELIVSRENERAQIIEKLGQMVNRRLSQDTVNDLQPSVKTVEGQQFRRGRGGRWENQFPPSPPLFIIIEFKPTMALSIIKHAKMNLFLGLLSTILFVLANLLLYKLSVREEKLGSKLSEETQLARLGEMSAILGHEIRNPLASLKGHGQLLARKLKGDEREEKANLIVKEARRIELLTGQILDFAKSGTITVSSCKIVHLIETVCNRFPEKRLKVNTEKCPDSWTIDGNRMEQVLTNIVRNGLEASAPEGLVQISASMENKKLVITIEDNGTGIREDELENVFEPFRTNSLQGTGLGLTVAKRIVEGHKGTITAGNRQTSGAFFKIVIP
jgi:two-component system sensor histidine kinase HydH